MAYKYQFGAATLSGSLTQEGAVTAKASALSGSSLRLGMAEMSEADLEKIDGITNGSAAADKAVILDSSGDFTGANSLAAYTLAGLNEDAETVATLGATTSSKAGKLLLYADGGSNVQLSSSSGALSGSGALTMMGAATFGGAITCHTST